MSTTDATPPERRRAHDDTIVELMQEVSARLDKAQGSLRPLWIAGVTLITLVGGGAKFYYDWQMTASEGSPALKATEIRLNTKIDKLVDIANTQATTNALLAQQFSQTERRLQRLEDRQK